MPSPPQDMSPFEILLTFILLKTFRLGLRCLGGKIYYDCLYETRGIERTDTKSGDNTPTSNPRSSPWYERVVSALIGTVLLPVGETRSALHLALALALFIMPFWIPRQTMINRKWLIIGGLTVLHEITRDLAGGILLDPVSRYIGRTAFGMQL